MPQIIPTSLFDFEQFAPNDCSGEGMQVNFPIQYGLDSDAEQVGYGINTEFIKLNETNALPVFDSESVFGGQILDFYYLTNISPHRGAFNISRKPTISFSVVCANDIDETKINLIVNGELWISNGAFTIVAYGQITRENNNTCEVVATYKHKFAPFSAVFAEITFNPLAQAPAYSPGLFSFKVDGQADSNILYNAFSYKEKMNTSTQDFDGNPIILSGAALGNTVISLQWSEHIGVDHYNIYYGLSDGVSTTDERIKTTDTFYLHHGLVPNRRYYYAVTAVDHNSNESDLSNEISVKPPAVIC